MAIDEDVYCTLVMTDAYLPGAAVLAHSLRDAGTKKKLACLITQETLRQSTITELQSLYNYVIPIERIGNPSPANLYLMNRPDLLYAFTKINLWRLVQFKKVVYIDADVVALRAPDELFNVQEELAAAPDVGWPDIFNTGVMVLAPNMGDYWALKTLAAAGDSFDGADQGLLNQYFEHRPWKRLSFAYNCTPSANYQYEPAYRYYKRDIKLVHFIGSEKPWQQERAGVGKGKSGAYQELLGRWWAVYERHFKVPTYEYTSTGRREPHSDAVQQQVKSESQPDYYATGYPASATGLTTETPMGDEPQPPAEALQQGLVEPTPTQQQRKFSAPDMAWDATRAAPPSASKPEAANFPSQQYVFSEDPKPFQPPAAYPEPPRDMWYDVPKEKPKPLPAIFPWEERARQQPTRVFVEDLPPLAPPAPALEEEDDFKGGDEFTVTAEDDKAALEPKTPTLKLNDEAPWSTFGAVNKNAWDDDASIGDYVRALTAFQKNRGKVQVVQHNQPAIQQHILSPSNEPDPAELVEKVRERRESLILTDFPSSVERPSLPVTPAPRRRQTFWGSERSDDADMPPAEGVPEQADWNPDEQLEQLRRNSVLSPSDLKIPQKSDIPKRRLPSTSAPVPEEHERQQSDPSVPKGAGTSHGQEQRPDERMKSSQDMVGMSTKSSLSGAPPAAAAAAPPVATDAADKDAFKAAPTFSEPGFAAPSSSQQVVERMEAVLSPTETRQEEDVAP